MVLSSRTVPRENGTSGTSSSKGRVVPEVQVASTVPGDKKVGSRY